jgi:transcriptional repressor of dcmA and dcmR
MPTQSRSTTDETNTPPPLWTLEEVAAYLRVSPATVRRWTNTGLLSCYRVGGNRERRFDREAVLAFISQSRGAGAPVS